MRYITHHTTSDNISKVPQNFESYKTCGLRFCGQLLEIKNYDSNKIRICVLPCEPLMRRPRPSPGATCTPHLAGTAAPCDAPRSTPAPKKKQNKRDNFFFVFLKVVFGKVYPYTGRFAKVLPKLRKVLGTCMECLIKVMKLPSR